MVVYRRSVRLRSIIPMLTNQLAGEERVLKIKLPTEYQVAIQSLLEILLSQYLFDLEPVEGDQLIELRLLPSYSLRAPLVTELIFTDGERRYLERRYHHQILDKRYQQFDYQRRQKDLLKTHIYTFLIDYLGEEISPWGILTGVRPTKLVHYLRDAGFLYAEIAEIFKGVYAVSKEKTELLLKIVQVSEPYLPKKAEAKRRLSIYLGIPFCPSRCSYCSFPAFSLQKHGIFLELFLAALAQEITVLGEFIKDYSYQIDSLYIGGGTPTSLSLEQIDALLTTIAEHFPVAQLREYHLEAGRPETITREKLKILQCFGVNRISLNPQTMHDKTLAVIGRQHTVSQLKEVFSWARELNFPNINMDVIVGLPGEDLADFQSTIDQILALRPDSITVHTLSLKKAANFWEMKTDLALPDDQEVTKMLAYCSRILQKNLYFPYYLYRQKYILGNQENVGYALPNKESLYNMLVIDERETVIGLGGGAVTKVVNPEDWSLKRQINPKYPGDYITNIHKIINDKLSLLTSLDL